MSAVFHIATRAEWQLALAAGTYRTGSLDSEGFIHPLLPEPHRFAADPTLLEILLEEADGDRWRYRRQRSIERPLAKLGSTSARGVPFLRPEIALLYKAKHLRLKDQRDFDASAPRLDTTARAWLATALEEAHPGHPWGPELANLGRSRSI